MGTEWTYKIAWHTAHQGDSQKPKDVVVLVLVLKDTSVKDSEANETKTITAEDIVVRIWTNSDSSSDIVTSQHPLALYVSLLTRQSRAPVLNAIVTVRVQVRTADRNVSAVEPLLPPLRLLDNGNGDPDLVADDGVYSRYVTRYPAAGRYTFTVTATEGAGKTEEAEMTVYARQPSEGTVKAAPPCCGSRVPFPADPVGTGPFRLVAEGAAVNLLQVPLAGEQDRLPPSRIGDLQLRIEPESSRVAVGWTAPGDDFDEGAVSGYRYRDGILGHLCNKRREYFALCYPQSLLLEDFKENHTLL
jgi:hypothetical protein